MHATIKNENLIYDALIVGYGPVGATLANLLGQGGYRVAIADTYRDVFDKPRAINLDHEALRLFQRIDLAEQISDGSALHPGTEYRGVDGGVIKAMGSAPPPYLLGWPPNIMFVQPEAERKLRSRVDALESVDVFLEHKATAFEQTSEQVSVTFDAPLGQTTLHARYLIGCDGANSPTREWMGTTMTDLGFSEHWVVVDARVERDIPLPSLTTQYCFPDGPTTYVICSGNLRRWEMRIMPGENVDDYRDLDKIKARLEPFVDVTALEFWRKSVYHFNARVADVWRDRRVFLAGDAAHTMPPFFAQGLNSGLRDAANLFWKLSYVLDSKANDSLLDTYQTERRPHILVLTEIAKDLGKIIGETDMEKAVNRDALLRKEMENKTQIVNRQSLVPPIADGFLDDKGGEFSGALAPQPRVSKEDKEFLLDDLLSGFSMVELGGSDGALRITIDLETANPQQSSCQDTGAMLTQWMHERGLTMMIIRPDGVVWTAGTDAAGSVNRFQTAFFNLR